MATTKDKLNHCEYLCLAVETDLIEITTFPSPTEKQDPSEEVTVPD